MIIYKITNMINGNVYIGQTVRTLKSRIAGHKSKFLSGVDTHLYRAMRKYGWDNFEFNIVDTASTKEELDYLESYYIRKYDSIRHGYNMLPGAEFNPMNDPESKDKHDLKMRSDDVRSKISSTLKSTISKNGGFSELHKKHLSENKKAFYQTPRGKAVAKKFSEKFNISPEHRATINAALHKAVYCIDINGTVIQNFDSVKSAALWWIEHGCTCKRVNSTCDKIRKSYVADAYYNGLKWIYRV